MEKFKVGDVGRLDDDPRSVVYLGPHPTKEHYYLFECQDKDKVLVLFRDDFVFHLRNFEFKYLRVGDLLDNGCDEYTVVYVDKYRAFIIQGSHHKILSPQSYDLNCFQRVLK